MIDFQLGIKRLGAYCEFLFYASLNIAKDILYNEVWAGNSAQFIRKRDVITKYETSVIL